MSGGSAESMHGENFFTASPAQDLLEFIEWSERDTIRSMQQSSRRKINQDYMKPIIRLLIIDYTCLVLTSAITTAITFPWRVDPQGDESLNPESRRFYAIRRSRLPRPAIR